MVDYSYVRLAPCFSPEYQWSIQKWGYTTYLQVPWNIVVASYDRASQLLWTLLTDAQRKELVSWGMVTQQAREGEWYRLTPTSTFYQANLRPTTRERWTHLCVHAAHLHRPDEWIAFLLTIRADPISFALAANPQHREITLRRVWKGRLLTEVDHLKEIQSHYECHYQRVYPGITLTIPEGRHSDDLVLCV